MPSPFPCMDPCLERPAVFPGLHDRMITHLSDELQARLPEPYYAEISDFNLCYDRGPYQRRIRYRDTDPVPPVREEDRAWTGEIVSRHVTPSDAAS